MQDKVGLYVVDLKCIFRTFPGQVKKIQEARAYKLTETIFNYFVLVIQPILEITINTRFLYRLNQIKHFFVHKQT